MSETKLIIKSSLKREKKPFIGVVENPVSILDTNIDLRGGREIEPNEMASIERAEKSGLAVNHTSISLSGKFSSGFDVPAFGPEKNKTIREMIRKKEITMETLTMKGNNLQQNWTDFMDAVRLDITMRKEAEPTIRQFFYNEIVNTNFTRIVSPTELNPYGIVFEENNGTGQSVKQGQNNGGGKDNIIMAIYAAGYDMTLLAELFDGSWDLARLNDGVAVGYAAKRDDLAIAPIQAYTYGAAGTAKHTAASTEGAGRQEKLYNTIWNAIDDLAKRVDPVTNRRIGSSDLVVLCSEFDAPHVASVVQGLPSTNERNLGAIRNISQVLGYDGEVIVQPNKTVTYPGIPAGTVYVIKRNRYMQIAIKRGLTMEMSATPDPKTLSRESRAWYFVEGLYQESGVANFIQKVTLPTW